MSPKLLSSSVAAVFACTIAVGAQTTPQQSTPPTSQPTQPMADHQKDSDRAASTAITVIGCVQNESSVLKRGALGATAMGGGDEFVLTQARLSDGKTATEKPESETTPPSEPAATSGTQGGNFGKVYRVTGDKENDLKNYVGQRVQIVGMFKHEEDARNEAGAIGTSGRAPSGDLTAANTPEITITSVAPMSGSCSAPAIK